MEAEECLPENGPLKLYLQDIGYSDVQVIKKVKSSLNNRKSGIPEPKINLQTVETLDENIVKQIMILISTQMMFEEDVADIEKLLTHFRIEKNGMVKKMFQGTFGIAIIFLGLSLYYVIGSYAFIIVSAFYAYRTAYYLSRKHFIQRKLKTLASILQSNFMLLRNAIKFIEENKKFENNRFSAEFKSGFDFYDNFKKDFVTSVNEMKFVFMKSTQKLIEKFPLHDYMENSQYYLCNNVKSCYSVDICKLYHLYLLMQSEFLQRLILSLIPNVKVSSKNEFKELNKILTEICLKLLKIKNRLNKKFKFVFFNGIYCPKTKLDLKLSPKTRTSIYYLEEFVSNMRDTSNTFQNLLIKSRLIEENLQSQKIPDHMENDLVEMQNDLNVCQRNISDTFILLKKANDRTNKKEIPKLVEEDLQRPEEKSESIQVGFTDLDPKTEDEIFEAYFSGEKLNSDTFNVDDRDFEDRMKKKLEKEYSKNVIKELKLKIVERAKKWEKKEAELKQRKIKEGLQMENIEMEKSNTMNLSQEKNVNLVPYKTSTEEMKTIPEQMKNILGEEKKSIGQDLITKTLFLEKMSENDNSSLKNEETGFSSLAMMDSSFLTDIGKARLKILNISVKAKEECFGDADVSEEENEDKD